MSEKTDKNLGKTFKTLRESKDIPSKQVVSDNFSYPQIMKFEKGDSSISVEKLFSGLSSINLSLEEFQYAYNEISDTNDNNLSDKIVRAFHRGNTSELESILREIQKKTKLFPEQKSYKLIQIEIKTILQEMGEKSYKLTKGEIAALTNHLQIIKEWSYFEIWLFVNCVTVLDNKRLENLVGRLMHSSRNYLETEKNRQLTNLAALNVASVFINSDYLEPVPAYFKYVDEHIKSDFQLYEKVDLTYLKALFNYKKKPKDPEATEAVYSCVKAMEFFQAFDTAKQMKVEFEAMRTKSQI